MAATHQDFDRCYAAVSTRDPRFDGQFVLAVRTTRIYCRPSCPARTPRPQHCTFYPTSAAAHLAGYRACKRCLPEAVPGSPEWNTREAVAARAQRAQTARQLLVATELTAAEVAFASGFSSTRQFNDTVAEVFAMTPSQLRERVRRPARAAVSDEALAAGTVALRLQARPPFRGADVIDWMGVRAIAGLEHAGAGAFSRIVRLGHGAGRFTATPTDDHVRVTVALEHLADLPELLATLRRLFDLDADPAAIDEALGADPLLRHAVRAAPGTRLPGTVDATEMLVRAILGQQVSVGSARTAVQRLVDALGEPAPSELATGTVSRTFPSASAIAAHAHEVVRGPATRTRALVAAMTAVATGDLVLDAGRTLAETTASLEAIPGIGPWTSHYVALRVLSHPDIMLTGDSAARAGAQALGMPSDPRGLAAHAERHRPWRSYLMMHLWRAASPTTKET